MLKVICIFVCILPQSAYAMENEQNQKYKNITADTANEKILSIVAKQNESWNKEIEQQDWNEIEKYLPCANPNLILGEKNKISLLSLCIEHAKEDLVDNLLQRKANPNDGLNKKEISYYTPLHRIIYKPIPENDIRVKILKNLLKYKADPNIKTPMRETPLFLAIKYKNPEAIQFLIKYGADVNSAKYVTSDTRWTIFHTMVSEQVPKECFEVVLTHLQLNKNRKNITATIKTALLTFNRFNNNSNSTLLKLPQEIQYRILSYLVSRDYFHFGLCTKLLTLEYTDHYSLYKLIFSLTEKRLAKLEKILKRKACFSGRTALQFLFARPYDINYKNEIAPLLDGCRLQQNYTTLVKNPDMLNPDYLSKNPEKAKEAEHNLALRIANNL